ncbi:MAG: glycosyltransferase family 1 protein [Chloroflexi bacterium]|nr:MAG: glycosyltransferase family 1 protein [Chloroflexota bacterium]
MRIAINAQLLNREESYRGAGVSNYSQNLLTALGAEPGGHRFTAFVNDPTFDAANITLRRSGHFLAKPLARILWEQTALPLALKQMDADLVHGLVNVLPLATKLPGVVTVHDLSFVRMPEKLPPAKRFYLTRLCAASVAAARRVIAVSRQTADDLIGCFGVEARKIEVVYNGVAPHFRPGLAEEAEAFRRSAGLPERFLLYLGTLEPRKNLARLVDGYARWREIDPAARDVALVLAGGKGWYYDEIFQPVRERGLEAAVHFPGFIPSADLPYWYRAAAAFVYPSLFEGFGLPVAEAMACGTPVLCSDAASLLEVAGDAALIFPAEDTDGLVAALRTLFADDNLRQALAQRGLERSRRFTWERTARETVQVYTAAP